MKEIDIDRQSIKEAIEKIMKAADRYAFFQERIAGAHDRGTTEDYFEAERDAKKVRSELEEIVNAALYEKEEKLRDLLQLEETVYAHCVCSQWMG